MNEVNSEQVGSVLMGVRYWEQDVKEPNVKLRIQESYEENLWREDKVQ